MNDHLFKNDQVVWCMKPYGKLPPWPAIVKSYKNDTKIEIHFLGEHSKEYVKSGELLSFMPHLASLRLLECKASFRQKWNNAIIAGIEKVVQDSGSTRARDVLEARQRDFSKRMNQFDTLLPALLDYTPIDLAENTPPPPKSAKKGSARRSRLLKERGKNEAKRRLLHGAGYALCLRRSYARSLLLQHRHRCTFYARRHRVFTNRQRRLRKKVELSQRSFFVQACSPA
jgi:hypothetical protein